MQYQTVLDTVAQLVRAGWDARVLTHADGYPIYALTDPAAASARAADAPALLIAAGVHGEEPGAVAGLNAWLLRRARAWVGRVQLHVVPCINPWGIERGIRFGSHGRDLNREFGASGHPAVRAFESWLAGRRFALFMDLHEDCDFETLYLYELRLEQTGPSLGQRIVQALRNQVGISDGEDVEGRVTRDGIISVALTREEAKKRVGRPIALQVFCEAAPHVVTLETPGRLDLARRAGLHVQALDVACAYLAESRGAA